MKANDLSTALRICFERRENVLIVGQPGIGKSDISRQTADGLGYDYLITQPSLSDPTDYKGAPWVMDGKGAFLAFPEMQALIEAQRPLVYDIEDLGQAAPMVQAALMHLLLAREVAGHKISEHVRFVASTNRKSDGAGVAGVLEPVKGRFATIIGLDFDLDAWTAWALGAGLPLEVVAFCRMRGDGDDGLFANWKPSKDIENTVTPRTMAAAGRLISYGFPAEVEEEVLAGAIGKGAAAELVGFLQIYRSLPNPDGIFLNPHSAPVPEDPSALFAIVGVLAHRTNPGNAQAAFAYMDRLPPDYGMAAVSLITKKTPDVMQTRAFIQYAAAHQGVAL